MALSVKQLVRRRGALAALITSLGVAIAITIADVLLTLLGYSDHLIAATGWNALFRTLPFALGVFASLWLLLPIAADLSLQFVVTRAAGAAVLGAALLFVTQTIAVVIGRGMFWVGTGTAGEQYIVVTASQWLETVITGVLRFTGAYFILFAPVVILFAIVQWNWLKHHPAKFEVAGILDV